MTVIGVPIESVSTSDWTLTRDQLIEDALGDIGALGQGQTASAPQITEGATVLNKIVKWLQTKAVFLWTEEWVTKTFSASSVILGSDALNYTCIKSHTSANDNKPITGVDWTTYWKQTGSGGGAWGTATVYSAIGDFEVEDDTLQIQKAFIRYNGTDYSVTLKDKDYYAAILDKTDTGRPTVLWHDRQGPPGRVYLYNQPDITDYVLHYQRVRRLADFDASGDTPDFPTKWILPLQVMLSYRLAPKYGLPPSERSSLRNEANRLLDDVLEDNNEVEEDTFIKSAF